MNTRADVTVVMALHNGASYLEEAVRSVRTQTRLPKRLLVVDDASTDDSLEVARRLAAGNDLLDIIQHPENRGYPAALNTGIAAADTEYVAILDCDDIALPHWLELLTNELSGRPEAAAAGGGAEIITEDGERTGGLSMVAPDPERIARGANPFTHSSTLWRKQALISCGGYDPRMHGWEDTELFARVERDWELIHCGQVVMLYRQRPGSNTNRARRLWPELRRLMRKRHAMLQAGHSWEQAGAAVAPALLELKTRADTEPRPNAAGMYAYTLGRAFEGGGRFRRAAQEYGKSLRCGVQVRKSLLGLLRCGLRGMASARRRSELPPGV